MRPIRFLRLRRAYKRVFAGNDGALVLGDLCEQGNLNAQVHMPGDPQETAFRDGQRRMALRILGFLNMSEADAQKLARQATIHEEESFDGE
ncbi:hypothetical protein [Fodinicurvata sediminis]|uniref:Bbp19 family protein n=1 Tax=Fodinicurvata sediminis TaxID=1121832 RepID=UPI0003B67096|nr:hypothetical protein [Fodinicurvata sediminis]